MGRTRFPSERELKKVRGALAKGPASRPLPKNAAPVDRTKYQLCEEVVKYKNVHRLTQRALAKKLDIDEALVSKIVHYAFDEFTTDRLIRYVAALYPKVALRVEVAS